MSQNEIFLVHWHLFNPLNPPFDCAVDHSVNGLHVPFLSDTLLQLVFILDFFPAANPLLGKLPHTF